MEEKTGTHDNPISESYQFVNHGTWHLQNLLHAIQYNQILRHAVKKCYVQSPSYLNLGTTYWQ